MDRPNKRCSLGSPALEQLEPRLLLSVPPLQSVQAWTETVGSDTYVKAKVYDPVGDAWQEQSYRYDGTFCQWTISGLKWSDGVVVWKAENSFTDNREVSVNYALYDPNSGGWDRGMDRYTWSAIADTSYWALSEPSVSDGVVAWKAEKSAPLEGIDSIGYAVYDPESVGWRASATSYTWSTVAPGYWWEVTSPVVDQGLVAWQAQRIGSTLPRIDLVHYTLFDPSDTAWHHGENSYQWSDLPRWEISNLDISDCAVKFTATQGGHTENRVRGYDFTSGWYEGSTIPMAWFHADPTSGPAPLTTWLWDESIGGIVWTWVFGDGGISLSRSTQHLFTCPRTYTVTLYVSSLAGNDSTANTVTAIGYSPPVQAADPLLEQAIRTRIRKPSDDLTECDLASVTYLDASNLGISDLGGIEHCTELRTLSLQGNELSSDDLVSLSGLTKLVSLDLADNDITDAGLARIAGLTSLRSLSLSGNRITDARLTHLAGMTGLETLDLSGNRIAGAGLVHLAGMASLKTLGLEDNEITDAGLVHLAGLASVTDLNLSENRITGSGLVHVASMSSLGSLVLARNQITDAGLAHLAGRTDLTWLVLSVNRITDAGLEHLAGMSSLRFLSLEVNDITDAGLAHLEGMTSLTYLLLDHNRITDKGLVYLEGLDSLGWLTLGGNQITDAGLAQLASIVDL